MRIKAALKPSILGLVLFLFLLTDGVRARAETISSSEYRFRIKQSLERLEDRNGALQPEESGWLKESFPPDLLVQDVGGDPVPVDRKGLLHWSLEAEDSPQGRERLVAYLGALLHQVSWEAKEVRSGPEWEKSRGLLAEVYRGREFEHLKKKPAPGWQAYIRKILETLDRWLAEHLGVLGGVSGKWIGYLLYGIVLVLGAILIAWIIERFGPVSWGWKLTRAASIPPSEAPPEKDWRAWREEAYKKAQDGAFREAIRFLFISVLAEGHQSGWWIYEPEATNREHLARVKDDAERHEALKRLIERYERAWYGLGQPGKEEFQACETWVQQMEAAA